jgi:uncharacterized repeat protein (TIGR03803 family)
MLTLRRELTLGVTLAIASLHGAAPFASPTLTVLYTFSGGADGGRPTSGITPGSNGVLYGTAYNGGAEGYGVVFSLTPPASAGGSWTQTVLHSFGGSGDGQNPNAGVAIGEGGVLYGTTTYGGNTSCTFGCGTVYSLTPPVSPGGSWTETVIHEFSGADGNYPYSTPLIGPGGVLYGTCPQGGAGVGTAYSLTPPASPGGSWADDIIHNFGNGSDGAYPYAGFTIVRGVLYGATAGGGTSLNWGTIYSLIPPASAGGLWTKATLYAFLGPRTDDGGGPYAPPVRGSGGIFYGTTTAGTFFGDSSPRGTAYSLSPPATPGGVWTESVLYTFQKSSGGNSPYAPLIVKSNGTLFGTAPFGYLSGYGTAFELLPPSSPGGAWSERVLHSFGKGSDGQNPLGGLVLGSGGVLFGTTENGGASGSGTIYALTL